MSGKLLRRVRAHTSKASSGYYYKNAWQYFEAAHDLIAACLRVLRPGGRAAFVVQDSWYKEIPVQLGDLYVDIARAQGASAAVAVSFPVPVHMGQMNRGSKKYPKGDIHEHVVVVTRAP
jgi:hypothetical protein